VKKREADAKRKEESAKRQARRAAYKAGRAARIEVKPADPKVKSGNVEARLKPAPVDLKGWADRAKHMTDSELADAKADMEEGFGKDRTSASDWKKMNEIYSKESTKRGGGGGMRGAGGSGGQPRHPAGGPKGGQFAPKR
jgi:membrane protein involved in colicin uptake